MEDIKELIAQNKFWRTFIKEQHCWTPTTEVVGKLAYTNGYNKAKKELQEAERWRDLEKDPPIVKDESYVILLKDESGDTHNGYSPTEFEETEYIQRLLRFYTHWKPIN